MKEIRVDAGKLRQDRLEAVREWVQSLGVDPADVRPEFVLRQGEREWELHLSKFERQDGKLVIDHALSQVVSRPLVVGLGTEPNWPDFGLDPETRPVTVKVSASSDVSDRKIRDAVQHAIKTTRAGAW